MEEEIEIERRVSQVMVESYANMQPYLMENSEESLENLAKQIRNYTIIVYSVAFATGVLQLAYYPNFYYFKDELKQPPNVYIRISAFVSYPWTIKPLFGFIEDWIMLLGYKAKIWLILSCIISACVSALLFISSPDPFEFTVLYLMINVGIVISDVMAQGLSVVIISLKKAHAEQLARSQKRRNTLMNLDIEESVTEGKKIFGNYTTLRFIIRTLGKFIGGVLAKTIRFGTVFAVIGSAQVIVMAIVIVVPEERKHKWLNNDAGSLCQKILSFFKSISTKTIILAFVLVVLTRICPNVTDVGDFILTDEMKWTPFELSFNLFIAGIVYFVAMIYLVNLASKMKFMTKMYYGACSFVFMNYLMYRFVFYENISFGPMYLLTIISTFASNFSSEIMMIAFIGRYSTVVPKGMESFCVAAVISLMNFSGIQGGTMGAALLSHYGVKKGTYENLVYPVAISFGYSVLALLTTPFLGK